MGLNNKLPLAIVIVKYVAIVKLGLFWNLVKVTFQQIYTENIFLA